MRTFFIVNPVAGGRRAGQKWLEVSSLLAREMDVRHAFTERQGHAFDLARKAVDAGFDRVVAVGGDGTTHEVVNGLMEAGGETLLGIIPAGTGNDFPRVMGIPVDYRQASLNLLSGGHRTIDLGMVNDRYFINVGGVGFDAEVAADVNRKRWSSGSTLPYIVSLLKLLATYNNARVSIYLDEAVVEETILLVAVGNSQSYGGGMRVVPRAVVDDGFLDVCVGGNLTKMETLSLLPKVFTGKHLEHPKVRYYTSREVTIESDTPLSVHADGETVGQTPAVFRLFPRRLKVWLGRDVDGRQ